MRVKSPVALSSVTVFPPLLEVAMTMWLIPDPGTMSRLSITVRPTIPFAGGPPGVRSLPRMRRAGAADDEAVGGAAIGRNPGPSHTLRRRPRPRSVTKDPHHQPDPLGAEPADPRIADLEGDRDPGLAEPVEVRRGDVGRVRCRVLQRGGGDGAGVGTGSGERGEEDAEDADGGHNRAEARGGTVAKFERHLVRERRCGLVSPRQRREPT